MDQLKNKVAVITGASRGVGRASAEKLAGAGCHVVLASRTSDELQVLASELEDKFQIQTLVQQVDVTKEEDVRRLAKEVKQVFGKVDILINNAGVGKYGTLEELSVEDYDWMMNTNMKGTFLFTKFIFPIMKEQKSGHILNVSSVAGLKGLPNETIYCATKHAQMGFAHALDYEARQYGVRVSNVCPGGIKTHFAFGTGRTEGDPHLDTFSTADEIAETILFTLSQPTQSRIIDIFMRPMAEEL